jgi:hypothetical protein
MPMPTYVLKQSNGTYIAPDTPGFTDDPSKALRVQAPDEDAARKGFTKALEEGAFLALIPGSVQDTVDGCTVEEVQT